MRTKKKVTFVMLISIGGGVAGGVFACAFCPGNIAIIILAATGGCVLTCTCSIAIVDHFVPDVNTTVDVIVHNFTVMATVESIVFDIRKIYRHKGINTEFKFEAVGIDIKGKILSPELFFKREGDNYKIYFPEITINQKQYFMLNEAMAYFFAAFIINRIFQQITGKKKNNIQAMEFAHQISETHTSIDVEGVKAVYALLGFLYPIVH